MQTADLDVSTKPGKWTKRGVQPPVESSPSAPLAALNALAAKIREEADPVAKSRLEAEYAAQAKALEEVTTDSTSVKLGEAIIEIVSTFAPIVDPHPDAEESIRMPETMTRAQWQEVHGRIMQCKRAAAGWLAKSRRFASERWGAEFVGKVEAQMELALGIEHRDVTDTPAVDVVRVAMTIGRRASALQDVDVSGWDQTKRSAVLDAIHPVLVLAQRLGCTSR
jgi:hypothetical protein